MADREKLIELMDEYEYPSSVTGMADHLLANGVTFQKWIPVTERLPENGDVVICFIKNGEQDMLQWDTFENTWVGRQWTYKRHAVTHWMPLPEPPQDD